MYYHACMAIDAPAGKGKTGPFRNDTNEKNNNKGEGVLDCIACCLALCRNKPRNLRPCRRSQGPHCRIHLVRRMLAFWVVYFGSK